MLKFLSWLYLIIVSARNKLYDFGILKTHWVEIPVISVGNLSAGGTGKTPFVIYLTKQLQKSGKKIVILTRGYGRKENDQVIIHPEDRNLKPSKCGDEPLILRRHLPDTPIIIDGNRVRASHTARQFNPHVLLLDDGFQHRRIGRSIDIVLWDATTPRKLWQPLPYGRLREGFGSLRRADMLIITRADDIEKHQFPSEIAAFSPRFKTRTKYEDELIDISTGERISLDSIKRKKTLIIAGIGNPGSFFRVMEKFTMVCDSITFSDHHRYTPRDIEKISERAEKTGANLIVMTEKDAVNFPVVSGNFSFCYLPYGLEIEDDEERFISMVENICG